MPYCELGTQSLEVFWETAPAVQGAWWIDYAAMTAGGTAVAPHTRRGLTTGTTPITLVPAPTSGLVNCLVNLAVRNADSVQRRLHVQIRDGASVFAFLQPLLDAGDVLFFDSRNGWYVLTDSGATKGAGGGGGGPSVATDVNVTSYGGVTVTLGQHAMSGSIPVVLASDQASIPVAATVSNFPATQTVAGAVSVSNFPATQTVAGAVSVSNFPATQTVAGAVSVSNFPATQPVSGTVAVSNFPTTVTPIPAVSGGPTRARVKSAASTNATGVKASPGQLYGLSLSNSTAADRWLKLYDKASAPTVGSDTPAWTELIPAGGGRVATWPLGIPFSTGIAYAITTGVADSDTGATAVDDVHGVLLYK